MKYSLFLLLVCLALACLTQAIKRTRDDDAISAEEDVDETSQPKRDRPINPLAKVHPDGAVDDFLFFVNAARSLPPRTGVTDAEKKAMSLRAAQTFFSRVVPVLRSRQTLHARTLKGLYFFMMTAVVEETDRVTVTWRNWTPNRHTTVFKKGELYDARKKADEHAMYLAELFSRAGTDPDDKGAYKIILNWTAERGPAGVMFSWVEVDSRGKTQTMHSLIRPAEYEWAGMAHLFDAMKGKKIMLNA